MESLYDFEVGTLFQSAQEINCGKLGDISDSHSTQQRDPGLYLGLTNTSLGVFLF